MEHEAGVAALLAQIAGFGGEAYGDDLSKCGCGHPPALPGAAPGPWLGARASQAPLARGPAGVCEWRCAVAHVSDGRRGRLRERRGL